MASPYQSGSRGDFEEDIEVDPDAPVHYVSEQECRFDVIEQIKLEYEKCAGDGSYLRPEYIEMGIGVPRKRKTIDPRNVIK